MAFRYSVVFLLLFLVSCAQVKSLEGGPNDELAPKPYAIVPRNETVNFKGQAIALTFNEYVKLNNPVQTITIMPNDVKVNAELREKTLMLYWDEQLKENTTYSIFLNRTVKDVSESNDSIMQLVFSTGPYIDSMSYTTYIVDASGALPQKNVVVGLFDHPDSLRPIYFTQTDANGKATLNYLKEGSYFVRAFDDQSKQGTIGKNDAIAFKEEPISPTKNTIDSLPMRMFSKIPKPKITTFSYKAPAAFFVGANTSLSDAAIMLNDTVLTSENVRFLERDSFVFHMRPNETNPFVLSATAQDWSDTIKTRINTTKNKFQNFKVEKSDYLPGQSVVFSLNDIINAVDTSKIVAFNLKDSSRITNYTYAIEHKNELHFYLPNIDGDKIKFTLKSGSVSATPDWKIGELEQIITKREEKEFGILNVKITGYTTPLIVEMLLKGKVIKKEFVKEDTSLKMEYLEPGEYTFRITLDANNNEKWDTGDFEQKIQPEEILLFSKPTKVRANWELEVELVAEKEQP